MDSTAQPVQRSGFLISAASLVVILAGLKAAASIVTLLLVAVFIALVSTPALLWLRRKRVPSPFAVLLVGLLVVAALAGLAVLLGASLNGFVQELPVYTEKMNSQMGRLLDWLRGRGLDVDILQMLKSVRPASVMSVVGNVFAALGGVLGNSFVIVLVVIFILIEVPTFESKFRVAFGDAGNKLDRMGIIAANVVRYLGLKTLVSLITGAWIAIWVAAVGLDFPLLWGLLAFLLNYIPTFGSVVAAIPPVLLALVLLGPAKAGLVGLGFLLANLVMGNIVEPRLMGKSMGLSTLVVLLSLLGWGWILGTGGMFFAVPLTMALKIILEGNERTRWFAVLMGPGKRKEPVATES